MKLSALSWRVQLHFHLTGSAGPGFECLASGEMAEVVCLGVAADAVRQLARPG